MKTNVALALLLLFCLPSLVTAEDSQVLSEQKRLRSQVDSLIAKLEANAKTGKAVADADAPESQRIMLRTREGYYLRAKLGGGNDLVADVKKPKTSEVFTIEWLSPVSIRLRTREGYYVGARLGGGANVDASVKEPRSSEVFTVEWQDAARTRLRLRTREGFYVHPVRGGGGDVDARIRKPKTSEVLTLVAAS